MCYGLSPDLFTIMSVYNVHPFSHSCGLEQSSQCEINILQPVAMVTVANDWQDDLFLGWVYESHTVCHTCINSIIVAHAVSRGEL